MSLGAKIREYRIKRGFTQAQMADKLGMTEANFSSYERDKSVPPSKKLSQIATILTVPVDFLFGTKLMDYNYSEGYIDEPTPYKEKQKELKEIINKLSIDNQFPLYIQKAIERESINIRNSLKEIHIEFKYTPEDILQLCLKIDSGDFIEDIIKMLERVKAEVPPSSVSDRYANLTDDVIKLAIRINKLSPVSKTTVITLIDNLEIIDVQSAKKPEKEA